MSDEGRTRQGRVEETAQRRRRRGDEELRPAQTLHIPEEVQARLDREGLMPRWANDEGNRLHRLTKQDDYDPVPGVEPVPVGLDKSGKPILAHLLAKPREFFAEDQAVREARRKGQEKAMLQGATPREGENPNPGTAPTYVAKGSSIGRGNQILE